MPRRANRIRDSSPAPRGAGFFVPAAASIWRPYNAPTGAGGIAAPARPGSPATTPPRRHQQHPRPPAPARPVRAFLCASLHVDFKGPTRRFAPRRYTRTPRPRNAPTGQFWRPTGDPATGTPAAPAAAGLAAGRAILYRPGMIELYHHGIFSDFLPISGRGSVFFFSLGPYSRQSRKVVRAAKSQSRGKVAKLWSLHSRKVVKVVNFLTKSHFFSFVRSQSRPKLSPKES